MIEFKSNKDLSRLRRWPRLNNRMLILSPFDNSVIQRD